MKQKVFSIHSFSLFLFMMILLTACNLFAPSFKGEVVNPVMPAPEISVTDHNGHPFQLSSLRGKIVALFFGYVNCPDECPATMAKLKQSLDLMGEDAQNVQVILVSTDPVRDTPQAMKDFLGRFNPTFLGIPGSPDNLEKIWDEYGVLVLDGGETHSSLIYVVDQSGDLRLKIDADSAPEEIASDLKILYARK
jgi:protein SCO1